MFETQQPEKRSRLRENVTFKMMVIGILVLLLLIPLAMVGSLIQERESRAGEAFKEVASSWGDEQTLGGPVLTVPYAVHLKDADGKVYDRTTYARFLPQGLKVEGTVTPERRHRGIFEVVVYRSDLRWTGTFQRPDLSAWGIAPEDIQWRDAYVALGIPDLRGIRSGVELAWGEGTLQLEPGGQEPGLWDSGLRAGVPGLAEAEPGRSYAFAVNMGLSGSQSLRFLPLGKQTTVSLRSNWPSPSFKGAFLPESSRVTATGFDATWNVSWFGRSYPQQWRADDAEHLASAGAIGASAFGVGLFLPVDSYQKTERSRKYGVLFLALTFLTFFLYEQLNRSPLHAVNYLLVGFALCLFYLLLLSISEHAPFGLAYLIASGATVLLIGGYSAAILHGALRALLMTAVLATLYGYLYVLLQLEDYALLLGSTGLFVILALVMYLTRKLDWGGRDRLVTPPPLPGT